MRGVCVYTLGCRLNQTESESIADAFAKQGWSVVDETKSADLYVVNTCTVTSKAEQKCRRMIRHFSQRGPVVVTGCYAELNQREIEELGTNVVVFSLEQKSSLLKLPHFLEGEMEEGKDLLDALFSFHAGENAPFAFDANEFFYHSRAYLKIQDGCDNACAYCRVHVARGKGVDLPRDEAVRRALAIERKGFHEIMLTGVNLTMYDHNGAGLGALVEALLEHLGPDVRIRLSSMEPDHVDDRLLKTFKDFRMQPHFHIPIQSASRKVLKRVNRYDDMDHVRYILDRIRKVKDDPFIAADVITGLPGEGEKEFQESYDFFKEENFSMMHVFPFSPRPDTPLEHAKDRVPESVRDQRAKILRTLSDTLNASYCNRQEGRETEAILETRKNGLWWGTTGNYLEVAIQNTAPFAKRGDLVRGIFGKDAKSIEIG